MELNASLGRSVKASGCRGCGNVFTTLGNFDKHHRWPNGQMVCVDPASVGLELKSSGRWGLPAKLPLPTTAVEARTAEQAMPGVVGRVA